MPADEAWGVTEKFQAQACYTVEDMLAASELFTLQYLNKDMKIALGICGRIAKALKEMSSPPPTPPPLSVPPPTPPKNVAADQVIYFSSKCHF